MFESIFVTNAADTAIAKRGIRNRSKLRGIKPLRFKIKKSRKIHF